jgi:hypothetical protein
MVVAGSEMAKLVFKSIENNFGKKERIPKFAEGLLLKDKIASTISSFSVTKRSGWGCCSGAGEEKLAGFSIY